MTRGIFNHPAAMLVCILLAAAALRLPHMGGPLDEPHAWRQADTAQYARAFHEEGFDLLHPSVCWLGGHKTLVLEFPLPEALMALGYRATGGEHLPVARAVTLAFFLGAAAYLFLLVRLLFDVRVAGFAAGIFCLLPLGLYYSRAVHVDPAALLFAHAAVYHAVRGYGEGSARHLVATALWAVLAALVKVPYVFYFALPIALFAATRFDARRLAWLVLAGVPAVIAMIAWRQHALAVNATVPDWSFIPRFEADFAKHASGASRWFFGAPELRWDPDAWAILARRFRGAVAGPFGTLLTAIGLAVTPLAARRWGARPVLFVWGWVGGVLVYVLVFMGLNVIHDYYQLPLLAVVAVVSAIGLEVLRAEGARVLPRASWMIVAAILAVLMAHALRSAGRRYYVRDAPRIEAAAIARAETPAGALLVTAVSGADRADDPRVLYRAHRYGWSVAPGDLDREVVAALRALGATHLLVVLKEEPPPGIADIRRMIPAREFALGRAPWRALLFTLEGEGAR